MLIETGKHALKQQGAEGEQAHELLMQKNDQTQEKEMAQTPQEEGLARAAKSDFAKMAAPAFGQ